MSKPVIQKIVCGAVVMNKGKALIIQRGAKEKTFPGMWELPSGKKEDLESTNQAAIREVKEETGLDVSIGSPFHVFNYSIEKEQEIRDTTQINYIAALADPEQEVVLSAEHQAYKWITEQEISSHGLSAETQNAIRLAFHASS